MEILFIIIGAIIFFTLISGIVKIINGSSSRRNYEKAIDTSSGLEKIRLIVRQGGIVFSLKMPRNKDSFIMHFTTESINTHFVLSDHFYGLLKQSYEKISGEDPYTEIARDLKENHEQTEIMEARVFGMSLAITLAKASLISKKKINKKAIKELIESRVDAKEDIRKEMSKMATCCIDFIQNELQHEETFILSRNLGILTNSLMCLELPKKGHYTDPQCAIAMSYAIISAYKAVNAEWIVDELVDNGLIG